MFRLLIHNKHRNDTDILHDPLAPLHSDSEFIHGNKRKTIIKLQLLQVGEWAVEVAIEMMHKGPRIMVELGNEGSGSGCAR